MNFADLENMWRSPHNRPSPAALDIMKQDFITDLRRRRRRHVRFLVATALPLVVFTVLVARQLVAPQPDDTPIHFGREWAIIPLYLVPWAAWFFIVRMHFRHRAEHRNFTASINASVAALLDENRRERARHRFIGSLLLASIPLLGLTVYQLRAVGKAGDEILLPALVFAPVLLLAIVFGMRIYDRRTLRPRQHQLERLLESYRATDPTPPAG